MKMRFLFCIRGLILRGHVRDNNFRFPFFLINIKGDRDEKDGTFDHRLRKVREAGQLHGVVQNADNQDADHQPENGSLTALKADAAQQRGRETVKFKALPSDSLTRENPGEQQDGGD